MSQDHPHTPAPGDNVSDPHPVVSDVEARQGRSGRPVLLILVVSTALTAIVFAIVWALFFAPDDTAVGERVGSVAEGPVIEGQTQSPEATDGSGPEGTDPRTDMPAG